MQNIIPMANAIPSILRPLSHSIRGRLFLCHFCPSCSTLALAGSCKWNAIAIDFHFHIFPPHQNALARLKNASQCWLRWLVIPFSIWPPINGGLLKRETQQKRTVVPRGDENGVSAKHFNPLKQSFCVALVIVFAALVGFPSIMLHHNPC